MDIYDGYPFINNEYIVKTKDGFALIKILQKEGYSRIIETKTKDDNNESNISGY